MFRSLSSRLWITYALLTVVVLLITASAVMLYLIRNPVANRQLYLRLETIALFILQINNISPDSTPERVERMAERVDKNLNVRIVIRTKQGETLIDTRQGIAAPIPEVTPLSAQLLGRFQAVPQFRDANRKVWIYSTRRMEDGNILVVASLRPPISIRQIIRDEFLSPFIRAGLVAFLLSSLLALWISHWVAKPLQQISKAAQAVASGGYQSIACEGPSEVRALARSFNEMAERVQSSQQSQRNFVANISHDLKTPLTSIRGFAQAMLDGTASQPQDMRQAAQVIYTESERMHRMVNDLLDLARLDSGLVQMDYMPLDLGSLVQSVVSQFAPQASQADIELKAEITELPTLMGDRDRLAQVFTNLVDNALRFTPAGGQVKLLFHQVGEQVEVCVSDTGPGVPLEELSRIFERFYQADKSRSSESGRYHGLGLGLAISKEIVTAHGGTIWAQNDPPSDAYSETANEAKDFPGCTFFVRLPFSGPANFTTTRHRPGGSTQ